MGSVAPAASHAPEVSSGVALDGRLRPRDGDPHAHQQQQQQMQGFRRTSNERGRQGWHSRSRSSSMEELDDESGEDAMSAKAHEVAVRVLDLPIEVRRGAVVL